MLKWIKIDRVRMGHFSLEGQYLQVGAWSFVRTFIFFVFERFPEGYHIHIHMLCVRTNCFHLTLSHITLDGCRQSVCITYNCPKTRLLLPAVAVHQYVCMQYFWFSAVNSLESKLNFLQQVSAAGIKEVPIASQAPTFVACSTLHGFGKHHTFSVHFKKFIQLSQIKKSLFS